MSTERIGPTEQSATRPKLSLFAFSSLRIDATPTPSAIMNGTVIGPVVTPPESKDVEYYFYNTINDVTENTYYGYYYTKNGDKLNCAQDKMILPIAYTEGDGGYYFGKVSDSSDWSFVKQINGNWYYFEAHDYIYN